MEYIDENEIMIIRRRLAMANIGNQDFGAERPLDPNVLGSAVARQTAGLGSYLKYTTPSEVAATLFYGIALNHAFENGNKRTALVAMLVSLQRNRTLLTETTEDELYDMATSVADHKFEIGPPGERTSDAEVAGIANWLTARTRRRTLGDRSTLFLELKAQLEAQGCEFGAPDRNYIKVYRETKDGRLSVKTGYPKANFEVGIKEIKRIRKYLLLDELHGIDSSAFYDDDVEAVVDRFVNTYRQVLDRLALT
ncbi:type II toxin-antitoxin system death-on-curing family toxin [Brevibacterium casei]|uniref:type II toxin-antitoxin system death-on-curing family toxin n=1 Tax=Brevibacterium casei TaxID=33889 RepID=UPI0011AB0BE5|nr:type II toxin-antitoxin system death-on-curing family toxin [Brevibacterium casei]